MFNVPLQRRQAVDLPDRMPAITMIHDAWPLSTNGASINMRLPKNSAMTLIVPGGETICRSERRKLNAYSGFHAVMLVADNKPARPESFDEALLLWTLRRSALVVVWGCGAYPASIDRVEKMLRQVRRATLIMCNAYTEAEWLSFAEEHAAPEAMVQALVTDSNIAPGTLGGGVRWKRKGAGR